MERAVHQIADVQLTIRAGIGIGDDQRMTVERHARRPRRRLAHREEIHTSAAVRDAGDVGAGLVHVVVAFHACDEPRDVLHLTQVPPLRWRPRARVQHHLTRTLHAVGQRSRRRIVRPRRFTADATVQTHA